MSDEKKKKGGEGLEERLKDAASGMHNPKPILDAILAPPSLTVAQIALLERMESPLLRLDVGNHVENIKAAYALNLPIGDALRTFSDDDFEVNAIVWADKLGWDAYMEKLAEAVSGVVGFWHMMPPASKKKVKRAEKGE